MASLLVDYFLNDGAQVIWPIRIALYAGLYLLCLAAPHSFSSGGPVGDSPLQAHVICKRTHRSLWVLRSAYHKVFLPFQDVSTLSHLVCLGHLCFVCCIVGFGGIYSRSMLALVIVLLCGSNYGVLKVGVSHNWYAPMWTILALIFTSFRTGWSVDGLLRAHWFPAFDPEPTAMALLDSGFTGKFVHSISCLILLSAGASKIRRGGWQWLHPETLSFFVNDNTHLELMRCARLSRRLKLWFTRWPVVVSISAAMAICLEVGVSVTLLRQELRYFMVVLAWVFHGSISALMIPNYLPQSVCYFALLGPLISTDQQRLPRSLMPLDWFVLLLATAVMCGCVAACIFEWEAFPLTAVPMFSRSRVSFSHLHILNMKQLRELANEFPLRGGFSTGGEDQFLEGDHWLRIVKSSDSKLQNQMELVGETLCATSHHLYLVVTSAMIRSLRSGNASHVTDLMDLLSNLMQQRKMLSATESLSFQVHLQKGWIAFSSAGGLSEELCCGSTQSEQQPRHQ